MSSHEYSQGICGDGAAILKDGEPITVEQILEDLRQGCIPNEQGMNRFGLDMAYFRRLFNRELNRPLVDFRPDELARVLARAARTADATVLKEPEFQAVRAQGREVAAEFRAEIRTVRDACDEYVSYLAFVSGGKTSPYLLIPETLDDAVIREALRRLNAKPESVPEVATEEMLTEGVESLARSLEKFPGNYTQVVSNIWEDMAAAATPQPASFDLVQHLHRQRAFSEKTFGPGARTNGVLDHIDKEVAEVRENPGDVTEWIDIVLLAFDGACRAGFTPEEIAKALEAKQAKNESRQWPDWRQASPDQAIEHVTSKEHLGGGPIPGCHMDEFGEWVQRVPKSPKAEGVPEGFVLAPKSMCITQEDAGLIVMMTGGDDEDQDDAEGVLWFGLIEDDEGNRTHGLNISCSECMEEGAIQLAQFDEPNSTPAGPQAGELPEGEIEPDLFWDSDNPEDSGQDSAYELASYCASDMPADETMLVDVMCAKRLPNRQMRIWIDDNEDLQWEWQPAGIKRPQTPEQEGD